MRVVDWVPAVDLITNMMHGRPLPYWVRAMLEHPYLLDKFVLTVDMPDGSIRVMVGKNLVLLDTGNIIVLDDANLKAVQQNKRPEDGKCPCCGQELPEGAG